MGYERGSGLVEFPDDATDAWRRLLRDVVGGGAAASPLIAALDRPLGTLLDGVDVDAALAAADEFDGPGPDQGTEAGARAEIGVRDRVSVGA